MSITTIWISRLRLEGEEPYLIYEKCEGDVNDQISFYSEPWKDT